jgi:hypothetical protein
VLILCSLDLEHSYHRKDPAFCWVFAVTVLIEPSVQPPGTAWSNRPQPAGDGFGRSTRLKNLRKAFSLLSEGRPNRLRRSERRITFEETVRFEKIHEETYRDFGFELVLVEPRSLVERVSIVKAAIR